MSKELNPEISKCPFTGAGTPRSFQLEEELQIETGGQTI